MRCTSHLARFSRFRQSSLGMWRKDGKYQQFSCRQSSSECKSHPSNVFFTVGESRTEELLEKKSRFIARVWRTRSGDEAMNLIRQHSDPSASHNCFAYYITETDLRCSDDGEPSGTAGKPMLSAIEAEGLREVAVLVTRHYGGIQLGTGGLARAYGGAARKALKACERVEVRPMVALHVTVPYELVGVVYNILGGSQGEEHFLNDSVRIDVEVEAGEAERVGQKITDVTRGKAHVEIATC